MKFASIWLWPLILGLDLCHAEFTNFDTISEQSLKEIIEEAIAKSDLQLQFDDLKNEFADLKMKYMELESTIKAKVGTLYVYDRAYIVWTFGT